MKRDSETYTHKSKQNSKKCSANTQEARRKKTEKLKIQ